MHVPVWPAPHSISPLTPIGLPLTLSCDRRDASQARLSAWKRLSTCFVAQRPGAWATASLPATLKAEVIKEQLPLVYSDQVYYAQLRAFALYMEGPYTASGQFLQGDISYQQHQNKVAGCVTGAELNLEYMPGGSQSAVYNYRVQQCYQNSACNASLTDAIPELPAESQPGAPSYTPFALVLAALGSDFKPIYMPPTLFSGHTLNVDMHARAQLTLPAQITVSGESLFYFTTSGQIKTIDLRCFMRDRLPSSDPF